jgi:hypothetical protein
MRLNFTDKVYEDETFMTIQDSLFRMGTKKHR